MNDGSLRVGHQGRSGNGTLVVDIMGLTIQRPRFVSPTRDDSAYGSNLHQKWNESAKWRMQNFMKSSHSCKRAQQVIHSAIRSFFCPPPILVPPRGAMILNYQGEERKHTFNVIHRGPLVRCTFVKDCVLTKKISSRNEQRVATTLN